MPMTAELESYHIIGFCGLSARTVSYDLEHPVTPPLWTHKSRVSCGVLGCRRKATCDKCFGCGVEVLCRHYTTLECSKCNAEDDTARQLGNTRAVNPSFMLPIQQMVTCLILLHGTTP